MIEGDCRHFDDTVSQTIEAAMRRIAQGVAMAQKPEADVDYERVFVPLVNDVSATKYRLDAAKKSLTRPQLMTMRPEWGPLKILPERSAWHLEHLPILETVTVRPSIIAPMILMMML